MDALFLAPQIDSPSRTQIRTSEMENFNRGTFLRVVNHNDNFGYASGLASRMSGLSDSRLNQTIFAFALGLNWFFGSIISRGGYWTFSYMVREILWSEWERVPSRNCIACSSAPVTG
jgi:hypothetical protein